MDNILLIEATIVFIQWLIPIAAVLSITLCLRPTLFIVLEKKLSKRVGRKKSKPKSVAKLEKEILILHEILHRNNRVVGLFCFILSIVIILKLV